MKIKFYCYVIIMLLQSAGDDKDRRLPNNLDK